jgi:hypothetical protein
VKGVAMVNDKYVKGTDFLIKFLLLSYCNYYLLLNRLATLLLIIYFTLGPNLLG